MNNPWPGTGDTSFESLARQYWHGWGEAMRQSAPTSAPSQPGWQEAINWWSELARGQSLDVNAAVERFNAQARDWYGQMQQVAARFAGREAAPADIAAEWKRAMSTFGENPFPEMFRTMQGQGAQGLDQWTQAAAPWLDAWRRESKVLLGMPTFGIGREHQERWQQLAQAQAEYQEKEAAYNALMFKTAQSAYAVFEKKLADRGAPGKQLSSARALFDVWIEAAEEAYAEMALSPEFRQAYSARVNAQMHLRKAVQAEVEQMTSALGMPTRSDLDAAFRKIADLERALRKLRDAFEEVRGQASQPHVKAVSDAPDEPPAPQPPTKGAARKAAGKKGKTQ
jgi:class III poly(R)-hydroxyalkanoic acid synthase PhaE subunit